MSWKNTLNGFLFLLLLILLSNVAAAQTPEYKDYTVQKGDTLWDISNKQLRDPFLWPKVWKENNEIKNPNRIYPNQRIKIPLYLLQKEITPEIKPAIRPVERPLIVKPKIEIEKPVERVLPSRPPKKDYLVPKDVLIASGYIDDSDRGIGMITDSESGRTALVKGDLAYISTNNRVNVGDKFYAVKVSEEVLHPRTGRKLGYLIEVLGIVEVVSTENSNPKIRIANSFSEVMTGSILREFRDLEPALAPDNPRKPDVNGVIVATNRLRATNGNWDIVYLDKGRAGGLEIGDLLATTLQSPHKTTNAVLQIIALRETTSSAIIRESEIETSVGDGITGIRRE